MSRRLRTLVLYRLSNKTMSHHLVWPRFFANHDKFNTTLLNLGHDSILYQNFWKRIIRYVRYDLIVCLHSTNSNSIVIPAILVEEIFKSNAVKLVFIGNEYKLMPEKMALIKSLGADIVASNKKQKYILEKYEKSTGCKAVHVSTAAYDPASFKGGPALGLREIDIGFRSSGEPLYFGHQDKRAISEYFIANAPMRGLKVDISMRDEDRLCPNDFRNFLYSTKAQIGTEGGTDFFSVDDGARNAVNAYMKNNGNATLSDVRENILLPHFEQCTARSISTRHVETVATGTVQILFEGKYNDAFVADEHFIAIRKDFENFTSIVEKLKDIDFCQKITKNAHDVVREKFDYHKVLDNIYSII